MSEIYDTAIEWLEQYEIWNYIAGLESWLIGVLVIFAALPFIIKYLKKRKSNKSKTLLDKTLDGKKVTSNGNFFTQILIFVIMSIVSGIACFNFGYERAGVEGGAIAACISLGMFAACLRNNRKHNRIQTTIEWSVLIPVVLFEMVVVGANFITVGESKPAAKVEQQRADYKEEISRLTATLVYPARDRTDRYDNRLTNESIKEINEKIDDLPVFRNSEKKFYEQAALFLAIDIDLIELMFNMGLGCLLIILQTTSGTRCNSYVCPWTIKRQIKIDNAIALALAGKASGEATDGKNTRTQKTPAHAKTDNFDKNVDSLVEYLRGLPDDKKVVYKDIIRNSAATTEPQAKILRTKLVTMGWLKVKGKVGTVDKYVKLTPGSSSVVKVNFVKRMLGKG